MSTLADTALGREELHAHALALKQKIRELVSINIEALRALRFPMLLNVRGKVYGEKREQTREPLLIAE